MLSYRRLSFAPAWTFALWLPMLQACAADARAPSRLGLEAKNAFLDEGEHTREAERLYPLGDYVAECNAALGRAPIIDCSQGVSIAMKDSNLPEGGLGEAILERCDRPHLNNPAHACAKGSTVLRISGEHQGDSIEWVAVCQKYYPDPQPGRYHVIDMIGYNRRTGDSCFFKNSPQSTKVTLDDFDVTLDAIPDGPLSDLNDPEEASKSWAMPYGTAGNCTTCHANRPFLRSPVFRSLKTHDGRSVVPELPVNAPYRVVAQKRLQQAYGAFRAYDAHPHTETTWNPEYLKTPATERACASCHKLGTENYCRMLVGPAYGDFSDDSLQVQIYGNSLSAEARKDAAQWAWHRVLYHAYAVKEADVDAALRSIKKCCSREGIRDFDRECLGKSACGGEPP